MNEIRVRRPRKLQKSVSGGVLAEAGRLNPVGPVSITLSMQPLNRVTMTLAEGDLDLSVHDLVEVYNQNGSVGIYRVVKITNTYRKERKIELSHGLDVLSDSMFEGKEEYKGTVAGMLQKIIAAQTQTIGGVPYWQLGTCEDTNIWNKDIARDNLMECLTDIAKKEEDFYFTFDQSTFPWTLNFVRRDDTVLSEFRLNRNTVSCGVAFDDSDLCTRLFLSVTEEKEEESGAGTYIDEGYYTYNDTGAQQVWGIICKSAGVDQQDFASWAALEAWVQAYFSRHNAPGLQITIDGIELVRLTGESYDETHMSRVCRVTLPEYSTIFNERVVTVNYPDALRNPMSVKVTLANKHQRAEDAFREISKTATSAEKSARSGGRGAHNAETYWRKTIGDTANGLYSRIEMTAEYIRTMVVDTANGLRSRINQEADRISLVVEGTGSNAYVRPASIIASITDNNGRLTSNINIDADNVYIGNSKSTTVIAGKCALSDVTVDFLAGQIAKITTLNVNALSAVSVASNSVTANSYNVGSNPMKVRDASVSDDGKTLYIFKTDGNITFKKAVVDENSRIRLGTRQLVTPCVGTRQPAGYLRGTKVRITLYDSEGEPYNVNGVDCYLGNGGYTAGGFEEGDSFNCYPVVTSGGSYYYKLAE